MTEYAFLAEESRILLYAALLGLEMGLVYDLFRVFRRVMQSSFFGTILMDLFFWGFTAYRTFYMMHTYSNGTLRWFAVLGVLVTVGLYMKCFSPYVVKLGVFILTPIKKISAFAKLSIRKAGTFLLKPFRMFMHLCKKCLTRGLKMSIIKVGHGFRKEKAHGGKDNISDQISQ